VTANLEGVDLKLRRADEHLDFLTDARTRFLKKPRALTIEYETKTGDYVVRYVDAQPPAEWGVTVSELTHLLRSALDNALWQLVLLRGGKPGKWTQFPIYDKLPNPPRKAGGTRSCNSQRDPWSGIKGVLPPDLALIKKTQPYEFGADRHGQSLSRWHPLSMLGHLNNIDKHRFLHPVAAAGHGVLFTPGGFGRTTIIFLREPGRFGFAAMRSAIWGPDGPELLNVNATGHLHGLFYELRSGKTPISEPLAFPPASDDSAEILRFEAIGQEHPEVNVQPLPAVDISFSDLERPVSLHDLYEIRGWVGRIVDHFRPDFA
jgi:hypothetical protein